MPDAAMPPAVFTLWRVTLAIAIIFFVPLTVYLLHSLWRAARSIRNYANETLVAARAIEANTAAIPSLDSTIAVATEVVTAAESVAAKLATIAAVLEARTAGRA